MSVTIIPASGDCAALETLRDPAEPQTPRQDVRVEEMPGRRLRVLILAYACSPDRGSEPGVGWHRVVEIARFCDTWVLCEKNEFEGAIRNHLKCNGPVPGLAFFFLPMRPWERALQHIPGLYYPFYKRWHRRAFWFAQRAHAELKFDIVHQLTMCGYREPGYLWKLDAPFVWGPLGGTQNYPWRFLPEAGLRGAVEEASRMAVNRLQLKFGWRIRQAARRACVVLAANSTVQKDLAAAYDIAPLLMLDTGIGDVTAARPPRDPMRKLRILWSGGLETRKALSLLLKALAHLPADVPYELRILGRGPSETRWRRLSRRLGIDEHVTWVGMVPHGQISQHYAWSDVFVFSSLRDTSGNVVLEALAAGLPVVCLDHQGVGDIVTAECGIKVPVTNPAEAIRGLCEAIVRLASDCELCQRLGQGAIQRAKAYDWSDQAENLFAVYRRIVQPVVGSAAGRETESAGATPSAAQRESASEKYPLPVRAQPCESIP